MTDAAAPLPGNRRDFLKASTLSAVGGGLLGSLALPAGAYAKGDDTIKIGLVGCGGRGTGAAAQALSTAGNVKLVALGDAFQEPAESAHRRLQAQFKNQPGRVDVQLDRIYSGFDAYQKVIDSDIDLVILTTPPGFRPIHYAAAVKKGINIFMEKPVAVDAVGVRQVLEATKVAKAKNLKVGVGLQRHHQPGYLETLKRIHDGAIGDVLALRCYWNSGGVWEPKRTRAQVKSEMEYQVWNWYYYTWLCGDHIVEQHIHNLDVGNWVKGAHPVRAHGMGGREVRKDKRYGEIYDHFAVEYEYADGSRMYSQCRHIENCWNSVTEHAHGTKGSANISGYVLDGKGTKPWKYTGPNPNPYQVEHDDLFAAIRSNTPYNEADNGAKSTMTAILGRMATYSGKVIEWDKAINSEISLLPEKFTWDTNPKSMPNKNGEYAIPVPGVTVVV